MDGPGRPTSYTQEIADLICAKLAEGMSLRAICRSDELPTEACVRQWAIEDREGFYSQYTKARQVALDIMADEVNEIADNESGDVARDRLRFDARRWYLSKMAPKRYGDKVAHVGGGEDDAPIRTESALDVTGLSPEQLRALASIKV